MPSCLDNVVTLGLCPDDGASTSGFRLIDAPGISAKNLAMTANETYTQGIDLALEKKRLSIIQVGNDFLGALQANRVIATITSPTYSTSQFNTTQNVGASALERGVVLHKTHGYRGTLRKTYVTGVQVYPLTSGAGELKIYDGYTVRSWSVNLTANQVNVFNEENLENFPYEVGQTAAVKILLATSVLLASAPIMCLKGCGGKMPNDCAWADGWDGNGYVRKEGYGINALFKCQCDYEQILCDLSNSYSGELIWLKWQINILEEQLKTNRFTNLVVYNRDELRDKFLPQLHNDYATKWNNLMAGLLGILNTYKDDCLNCRGVRWRTNI